MQLYCLVGLLQDCVPNAKVGFSKAMSSGWIWINKAAEGGPRVFRKVPVHSTKET